MAEYIALDAKVEVKGTGIIGTIESLGEEAISLLKQHDLYPIELDKWYNQQAWLDTLRELRASNFMNEVAVGMKTPDFAEWPPNVQTVHDALASVNIAYQMNHRGGKIGGYHYTPTGEQSGAMICDNPYPSDFDYGLIYRIVQKFSDKSPNIRVARDEDNNRKKGGDSCTYQINW